MGAAALGSRLDAGTKLFKKFASFARGTDTLSVAEKVYSIAGFLAIVTTFLLVMSVQTVRLQTSYRHMHATSAEAAINIGRIGRCAASSTSTSKRSNASTGNAPARPTSSRTRTATLPPICSCSDSSRSFSPASTSS